MDYFPLKGFKHVTNIGVLIYDLFVWSGCWRCSVVWEYPMYSNMVSDLLWRAIFGFDQNLEPVLPKLWKGFWFWILYGFLAYGSYSIASKVSFPLEIVFVSLKTISICSRNTHFSKSEGIMLQWQIFKKNISYLISFIIRSFFVLVLECYLPWLRMLFAVHLAWSRRIRNSTGKFFLSSRLRMLFSMHFV